MRINNSFRIFIKKRINCDLNIENNNQKANLSYVKNLVLCEDLLFRYTNKSDYFDEIHAETFVNSFEFEKDKSIYFVFKFILNTFNFWNLVKRENDILVCIYSFSQIHRIKFHKFYAGKSYLAEDINSYKEPVIEVNSDNILEFKRLLFL